MSKIERKTHKHHAVTAEKPSKNRAQVAPQKQQPRKVQGQKPEEKQAEPQAQSPQGLAPKLTSLANTHAHAIPEKKTSANLGQKTLSRRPWEKVFFETLSQTANITISCRAANVSRRVVYDRKAAHPEFAKRMHDCCEQAVDLLEAHAWNRATRGVERGIWSKDKEGNPVKVETIREYSDRLHEILLRAHRPEKYSPKIQQEISGPGGSPFAPNVIAPTVIFQIPDNGRGTGPVEINAHEICAEQLSAPQQEPEHAPEPLAETHAIEQAQPEPAKAETEQERKWRLECARIDRANESAMARIRSEGRDNEAKLSRAGSTHHCVKGLQAFGKGVPDEL